MAKGRKTSRKRLSKNYVKIVEMGLRDGLQNEKTFLDINTRVELAQKLAMAGLQHIEAGAFVSPKWVPQMADSAKIIEQCQKLKNDKKISSITEFSALVPNEIGMNQALQSQVKEVAVFAACTESFSKKNINCTIDESFDRFIPIIKLAKKNKIKVRGYLSVCFYCPYEGKVDEKKVVELAKRMNKLGVYEISIGDTIGAANAGEVKSLINKLKKVMSVKMIAGHFHDTRGQALANILMAYQLGIRVFDTSIGGLGGCPYAPGASGNVATEDVVFMLNSLGADTGINVQKLVDIHPWLQQAINHDLYSRLSRVGLPKYTSAVN